MPSRPCSVSRFRLWCWLVARAKSSTSTRGKLTIHPILDQTLRMP
jgi:hypothetical protein